MLTRPGAKALVDQQTIELRERAGVPSPANAAPVPVAAAPPVPEVAVTVGGSTTATTGSGNPWQSM